MQDVFENAALVIFSGDTEAFGEILRANPAVATHKAEHGHPTLLQMVACEEPHIANASEIASLLLDAGAPTTWPLISAAGCNAHHTLLAILGRGVAVDTKNPWTPLDEALYWNNPDMVQILLDRGASLGRLRRAAGIGDLESLEAFFTDAGLTPSAGPIAGPFADTVDPDTQDDPQAIIDHAFVMAVNCGQQKAAESLASRGAAINATPPGYHWRGTALHAAIWRDDAALVQWLLGLGADPSVRDGLVDADALGWAHHHNPDTMVELLTQYQP